MELLVERLPARVSEAVRAHGLDGLLEVVLDLGRVPTARYPQGEVVLSSDGVQDQEIEQVVAQLSAFGEDNRAGIPRTLHRISAIRNRRGRIVGLTLRIGRSVQGSAGLVRDMFEDGRSVLLLGAPGVGKTTMLREAARILADELNKRVIIVDTSNEIGGDGDIPHAAIGRARRMQVQRPELQHQVMIEAVENHTPEVIVIDEIGSSLEAEAARTIAERGVQLIGTAHGNTLQNLMQNPTLSDLIGGIESVTLSDEEARRRGTQKTVLERRNPPTFDALVEIQAFNRVAVHQDIAATVDALLRGFEGEAEVRTIGAQGEIASVERITVQDRPEPASPIRRPEDGLGSFGREPRRISADRPRRSMIEDAGSTGPGASTPGSPGAQRRIMPFGISRTRLEEAISTTRANAAVVESIRDADAVITLRPYYRRRSGPLRDAEARGIPVYVLRNNSERQIEQSLFAMRHGATPTDPTTGALREAEEAIAAVTFGRTPQVELVPQSPYLRRLQHELVGRHGQRSVSRGREPYRRVVVTAGDRLEDLPWHNDDSSDDDGS
ncbi:MAG: AAA family ATPase [Dehalococcoidia bacterium]|nr:AAA family ATPase [Dehalococcoidia bacterium]